MTTHFDSLPDEMILHMCSFMNLATLRKFSKTCRKLYVLANDEQVWRARLAPILQRQLLSENLPINRISYFTLVDRLNPLLRYAFFADIIDLADAVWLQSLNHFKPTILVSKISFEGLVIPHSGRVLISAEKAKVIDLHSLGFGWPDYPVIIALVGGLVTIGDIVKSSTYDDFKPETIKQRLLLLKHNSLDTFTTQAFNLERKQEHFSATYCA